MHELTNMQYGDVTSTGRVLSNGTTKDRAEEIKKWAEAPFPQRTKDYFTSYFYSDRWDSFSPRDGDIVINTSMKSGTTWTQAIVANLLFKGKIPGWDEPDKGVFDMTPWVDLKILPYGMIPGILEHQTHRRFIKSHLAFDGLPYNPNAKYLVLFRDVRDVAYSYNEHLQGMSRLFFDIMDLSPYLGPRAPDGTNWTGKKMFYDMIDDESDGAGFGLWSYWHHYATWRAYKHLPNVKLIHYNKLRENPKKEIADMAAFLEIDISEDELDVVVQQTTLEYMKANVSSILGRGLAAMFEDGGQSLINKGTNGRWKDELTDADIQFYMDYGTKRLGEKEFHWLRTGEELQIA